MLSALSSEVEIDGQWRLTIPANLREYAGLEPEKPVMVIGALNRIELWQTELRASAWRPASKAWPTAPARCSPNSR